MDYNGDGTRERARIKQIVEGIDRFNEEVEKDPDRIKMLIEIGDERKEELLTYTEILEYIEKNRESGEEGIHWTFREIVGYRNVRPESTDYRGCAVNVLIRWETGQVIPVPLTQFLANCPYKLAMYAIENDLLEKPLWKKCKRFARRRNTFFHGQRR